MDAQTSQVFIEECRNAFGFLVNEHGFRELEVKINKDTGFITVTFARSSLAVECILDVREKDVDVKVAKLEDGRMPNVYEFNQSGERVRTDVMSIMRDRKVSDRVLNQRSIPTDDRGFFRVFLNHYAFLLENYGKDILADNPNGF